MAVVTASTMPVRRSACSRVGQVTRPISARVSLMYSLIRSTSLLPRLVRTAVLATVHLTTKLACVRRAGALHRDTAM